MTYILGGYQTDFDDDREPAGPRLPRTDKQDQAPKR